MKEYKIVRRGLFTFRQKFEEQLNELSKDNWQVVTAIGNTYGLLSSVILERPRKGNNRSYRKEIT